MAMQGCGASLTHRIDNAAKRLAEFLDWLMGKGAQADLPGRGPHVQEAHL